MIDNKKHQVRCKCGRVYHIQLNKCPGCGEPRSNGQIVKQLITKG